MYLVVLSLWDPNIGQFENSSFIINCYASLSVGYISLTAKGFAIWKITKSRQEELFLSFHKSHFFWNWSWHGISRDCSCFVLTLIHHTWWQNQWCSYCVILRHTEYWTFIYESPWNLCPAWHGTESYLDSQIGKKPHYVLIWVVLIGTSQVFFFLQNWCIESNLENKYEYAFVLMLVLLTAKEKKYFHLKKELCY